MSPIRRGSPKEGLLLAPAAKREATERISNRGQDRGRIGDGDEENTVPVARHRICQRRRRREPDNDVGGGKDDLVIFSVRLRNATAIRVQEERPGPATGDNPPGAGAVGPGRDRSLRLRPQESRRRDGGRGRGGHRGVTGAPSPKTTVTGTEDIF